MLFRVSIDHAGLSRGGRRCSRPVLVLVSIVLLTQIVPRVGRTLRSLVLDGHSSYSPVRRAISEVSGSCAASVGAEADCARNVKERAPVQQDDQRRGLSRTRETDDNTPLSQRARCRELPRSRTCGTDGVIVLHA